MDEKTQAELLAVVESNLPKMVGDVIKRRLEIADNADFIARERDQYKRDLDSHREAIRKYQNREAEIVAAQAAVAKVEREQFEKAVELKFALAGAKRESEFAMSTLNTVFRERVLVRSLSTTVPVARQYPGGGDYVEHHGSTASESLTGGD